MCCARWVREMYAFDVATALAGVPLLLPLPVRPLKQAVPGRSANGLGKWH